MFNLDDEIDGWCRAIHTHWFNRNAQIEELKDHLYCEIAGLEKKGLSQEQAFFIATERLGNIEALITEYAKNRGFVSSLYVQANDTVSINLEKWRNSMGPKKAATLHIVTALIFAAAIILSTNLLEQSQYAHYSQTAMYLLIALYMIPFSLLSIAGAGEEGSMKSEYLCIKRKITGLFK